MKAFLAIDAGGPGPDARLLEVAWVLEDGSAESHLVSPLELPIGPRAVPERTPGVAGQMLATEVSPAAGLASRLMHALGDCQIYCAEPGAFGAWLKILLDTAGLPVLPLRHVFDAYRDALLPLWEGCQVSAARSRAESLYRRADTASNDVIPQPRRAAAEAERLWLTWWGVCEQVGEDPD